jgi:ubiquinone/menaquinone biosynthesis C-methylase UbiE
MKPVTSLVSGTNADLIDEAARLYIPAGSTVVDVTFGKGVFWKKLDLTQLTLLASDMDSDRKRFAEGVTEHWTTCDLDATPYEDRSADVFVLDPPYIHFANAHRTDHAYNSKATTHSFDHKAIIDIYRRGLTEGHRVLKKGGYLLTKCMDEIEGGKQHWSHVEIMMIAQELGFYAKDLIIFTSPTPVTTSSNRWAVQKHVRKVHSYLWVFEKRS